MYKILATDQREYGPITADQLRDWIRQGRANKDTLTQPEGDPDWRPLSTFPEFNEALAAGKNPSGTHSSSSPGNRPNDEALLETARERSVDAFHCLSRAWDFFCADPWPLIGVTALTIVLAIAANSVPFGFVVNGPLLGGLYFYLLRRIRSGSADLEDAFAGFKKPFLQLLICSLLAGLAEIVGFTLCILPGLYLVLIWSFSFQLIIDKGLDFWPAMELSRKSVHDHFMSLLGLFVLGLCINLVGALLLGVGLFITLPVTILACLHAYEDLFKETPSDT